MEQYQEDFRSDIDMWADMWADAEQQGIHPPVKKEIATFTSEDDDPADTYFNYLDDMMSPEDDPIASAENEPIVSAEGEVLIQEQEKIPNPVYPDSVGPDYKTTPPVWASEEIVKEIQELKDKLFEMENQIAALGQNTTWKTEADTQTYPQELSKKFKDLQEKIGQTSSKLGVEHEPSPWWVVKRD